MLAMPQRDGEGDQQRGVGEEGEERERREG